MLVRIKTFADGATQGQVIDCGTHELATHLFECPSMAGCISPHLPINAPRAIFARVGDMFYRVKRCADGCDEVTVFHEDARPYLNMATRQKKLKELFSKHADFIVAANGPTRVLTESGFIAVASDLLEDAK